MSAANAPTSTTAHEANIDRSASHRHHGLALIPPPSADDQDPLRWPQWLKRAALFATAMTNFTSNFAAAGLSVATILLEHEYSKTASQVNAVLTFNFLLLGIGNVLWVPLSRKFGARPTLLLAYALLTAILIWTALVRSFRSLLAARCLSGFVSAAGESLVPGIVADVFFMHERATAMSGYTLLISSATAVGPLVAAFMVQYSPGTWRDFVWVCTALAGSNVVLLFVFYPESNYTRPSGEEGTALATEAEQEPSKTSSLHVDRLERPITSVEVVRKPWTCIWRTLLTVDREVSFWKTAFAPLAMVCCPDVLLAVYVYGTALAAQIILTYAFPRLLSAPPYLFSPVAIGLMQVAAIIAFPVATFLGGYVADGITARVVIRHGGNVEPAQRLVALLPAFWVAPVGCILVAFACSEQLHWIAIAFGFGMLSFGTVYAPNIVITAAVEAHQPCAAQALVVINLCKNLVAFVLLYVAVDWIESQGYLQVYMIMFSLVSLGMLLAGLAYPKRQSVGRVNAWVLRRLY